MCLDCAGNVTEKSVTGHLASGVPGSVAGMYEAWKRGGSLPWATLLAPAIRLANGHRVDAERSGDIRGDSDRLAQFPASRAQFLPGGQAPAAGTLWKQADLARTLQLISDSGPDVFYRGQIADLIVAEMERGHGLITKDDLRRYRPKWRTPIELRYRGYTIYSMPPASSGGVTMGEILNIMEGYDTLPAFGTAAHAHLLTEAMRRAFIDRNHWLGDPGVLDREGQLLLVVGTPGGPTIITTVAQVILDVLDQGMTLSDAVAAPRIHHQALPDVIRYERGGLSDGTVAALRGMGHKVEMRRGALGVAGATQTL